MMVMINSFTKRRRRSLYYRISRGCAGRSSSTASLLFMLMFVFFIVVDNKVPTVSALISIQPGMGFRTARPSNNDNNDNVIEEKIIIFEHTAEYGTGGLVYNQPTPIRLKDLGIPRYDCRNKSPFCNHTLMLGCGLLASSSDGDDGSGSAGDGDGGSNIPLGDMSPWFWLHNVDHLPGSNNELLAGASQPIYMGGNLEEAVKRIHQQEEESSSHPDKIIQFKFFTRYRKWDAGQLEYELNEGKMWTDLEPCDPLDVLRPYNLLPEL